MLTDRYRTRIIGPLATLPYVGLLDSMIYSDEAELSLPISLSDSLPDPAHRGGSEVRCLAEGRN